MAQTVWTARNGGHDERISTKPALEYPKGGRTRDKVVEVEVDVFGKKDSIQEFEHMRSSLKRAERFNEANPSSSGGAATVASPKLESADTAVQPQTETLAKDGTKVTTDEERSSIISIGAVWQGSLKIEGSVRVEGRLSGEIEARDSVRVAEGAEVDAKVRASVVCIAGRFQGQVHCSERLEIMPTGRVKAELTTKSLVVHEGAVLEGQVKMSDNNVPIAPSPTVTSNEHTNGTPTKPIPVKTPSLAGQAASAT